MWGEWRGRGEGEQELGGKKEGGRLKILRKIKSGRPWAPRDPLTQWYQDTGSVSLWCPWPLPHEPGCLHALLWCVSSHISFKGWRWQCVWGKSLLHILPVIMEQKLSPEVPWLMHFLLKFSILDQIHTSRSLASKCFRKVHNFVGGQTKGKWLRMALGRPQKTRLSSYKAPAVWTEHEEPEATVDWQRCKVCLIQKNS